MTHVTDLRLRVNERHRARLVNPQLYVTCVTESSNRERNREHGQNTDSCEECKLWNDYNVQKRMAPQVGLEPTTLRLTAGCSAIELLRSDGASDSP